MDIRKILNTLDRRRQPEPLRENFLLTLLKETILVEKTTPSEAAAILTHYGASPEVLASPTMLKAFRARFMMANHPDKGGDLKAVQAVNDAYDILGQTGWHGASAGSSSARSSRNQSWEDDSYKSKDEPYPGAGRYGYHHDPAEVWAQAGHSGGIPNSSRGSDNPRDVNYWKKRLWELSGKSKQEWTIMNYDGSYFRGMIIAYAKADIFPEMAKAMLTWDSSYEHRAIFAQRKNSKEMHLIWLDGHLLPQPVILRKDGMPGWRGNWCANDQQFMRKLPGLLDDIAAGKSEIDAEKV